MLHPIGWRGSIFIDTVGHSAGVVLFGLLLILLSRDRRYQKQQNTLSAIAAGLVLLWNVCELLVLGGAHSHDGPSPTASAVSYCCLSLLPAVLLHLSLENRLKRVAAAGYGLSFISIGIQFVRNGAFQTDRSRVALLLLAFGFAVLSLGAWLWSERRTQADSRSGRANRIAFLALFVFATSYVHYQPGHSADVWVGESIWRHAAIPIALIILLHDYRFLLLDTFLRVVVSAGWVALWLWAATFVNGRLQLWSAASNSDYVRGLVVTELCLVIYLLARSLQRVQNLLTRIVFRRPPLKTLIRNLQSITSPNETALLDQAAREIALYFQSSQWSVQEWKTSIAGENTSSIVIEFLKQRMADVPAWAMVLLPLSFSKGDGRRLCLGPRAGGRRYLSEDLLALENVRAVLVEQIERFRNEELARLVSEAELRALQAQINPHFLFNVLNTLYGTIGRGSPEARQMVLNLSDLFRARLQSNRTYLPLAEELDLVRAYLEIEALRLDSRLQLEMAIAPGLEGVLIPVLTIQPLVENAIRHGMNGDGVAIIRVEVSTTESRLRVVIQDAGKGFPGGDPSPNSGVGLSNVRTRLKLCYGTDLHIETGASGSKVWFEAPMGQPPSFNSKANTDAGDHRSRLQEMRTAERG